MGFRTMKRSRDITMLFSKDELGDAVEVKVDETLREHDRCPGITVLELFILVWVLGMVWVEVKQVWEEGLKSYIYQWWNWMDFVMMSLYLTTFAIRLCAIYIGSTGKLEPRNVPRFQWAASEPMLLAEGLFAIANVFSFVRILYLFQTSPYLGPLQISLGCMLIDILKFLLIFFLILTSFAVGLHQLYWYYDRVILEGLQCSPTDNQCERNTGAFSSIPRSYITLMWSLFSITNTEDTQVRPNHYTTEWIGKGMYIAYHLTSIIVFLNMLIAMMSNSFQQINENSDLEWKFHRSKLWMSFFDEGSSLSVPFNLVITPKSVMKVARKFYGLVRPNEYDYDKRRVSRASIRRPNFNKNMMQAKYLDIGIKDYLIPPVNATYREIIERLVHRYIHMVKNETKGDGACSEDDLLELKQDISSLRFELRDSRQRELQQSASAFDEVKRDIIRTMSQTQFDGSENPMTLRTPLINDQQAQNVTLPSLKEDTQPSDNDYMRVPEYTPSSSSEQQHASGSNPPLHPARGINYDRLYPNAFSNASLLPTLNARGISMDNNHIPQLYEPSNNANAVNIAGRRYDLQNDRKITRFEHGRDSVDASVQTAEKYNLQRSTSSQPRDTDFEVKLPGISGQYEPQTDIRQQNTSLNTTDSTQALPRTCNCHLAAEGESVGSQMMLVRREELQNFLNETLDNFKTQMLADITEELKHWATRGAHGSPIDRSQSATGQRNVAVVNGRR